MSVSPLRWRGDRHEFDVFEPRDVRDVVKTMPGVLSLGGEDYTFMVRPHFNYDAVHENVRALVDLMRRNGGRIT